MANNCVFSFEYHFDILNIKIKHGSNGLYSGHGLSLIMKFMPTVKPFSARICEKITNAKNADKQKIRPKSWYMKQ